jgi:hypothetical protein
VGKGSKLIDARHRQNATSLLFPVFTSETR